MSSASAGQLSTLVRKEMQRHRSLVIGGAVIIGLGYALTLTVSLANQQPGRTHALAEALFGAAVAGVILSCVLSGFFAGNAVAGERPTRSIEFMAYLPVPRRLDLVSRLGVAFGLAAGFLLVNALLCAWAAVVLEGWREVFSRDAFEVCRFILGTVLGVFGISWLISTVSRSPVVSTASGVMLMVLLLILGGLGSRFAHDSAWRTLCPILAGSLGLAGIVLGCVHHLQRTALEAGGAGDWNVFRMNEDLRVLVQKELRRQRGMLIAAGVFFTLPYLLSLLISSTLMSCASIGLMVSCVMAAFFGGNGIAGERPSRSLEFLAGLPVPRHVDLLSRLLVAGGLSLAFVTVSALVVFTTSASTWDFLRALVYAAGIAMAMFGISWAVSTRAPSAVISAACGLLGVLMLFAVGIQISAAAHWGRLSEVYWQVILPITIGSLAVGGIVGGSFYHLRRKVLE